MDTCGILIAMNDLKTWKIICQIRYPPSPLLVDNRGKIAAKWRHGKFDLTDWKIDFINSVIIYNKFQTTLLTAAIENSSVVMERPQSVENFQDLAPKFLLDTLTTLDVRKINRIGLRIIQLLERNNFGKLVANMRQKLYSLQNNDWDILGGNPVDVGLPLTLSLKENKANFNIEPIRKEQLLKLFESQATKKVLPDISLSVDFDLYKTSPNLSPNDYKKFLLDFITSGTKEILDRSARFVDHYGGFE